MVIYRNWCKIATSVRTLHNVVTNSWCKIATRGRHPMGHTTPSSDKFMKHILFILCIFSLFIYIYTFSQWDAYVVIWPSGLSGSRPQRLGSIIAILICLLSMVKLSINSTIKQHFLSNGTHTQFTYWESVV